MRYIQKSSQNLALFQHVCLFKIIGAWGFKSALFLNTMMNIRNESTNVPKELHIMQHIYRGIIHFPIIKCISNTDTALLLGQHSVHSCLEGIECNKLLMVNTTIGKTHHYRKSCPLTTNRRFGEENCEKLKLKEYVVKDIGDVLQLFCNS